VIAIIKIGFVTKNVMHVKNILGVIIIGMSNLNGIIKIKELQEK
jgi:hypothetical protein